MFQSPFLEMTYLWFSSLARLLTWFFNSCKNIRITMMVTLSPTLASDPSRRRSSLVPTPILHWSELCNFLTQRLHLDHANAGVLQPSLCKLCLLKLFCLLLPYPVARMPPMELGCVKQSFFSVWFKSDFTEYCWVSILQKQPLLVPYSSSTLLQTVFLTLRSFQPGK